MFIYNIRYGRGGGCKKQLLTVNLLTLAPLLKILTHSKLDFD